MSEAAQQLLCAWLDSDAGSSVPSLLHALDVRRHEPEAELAVRGLQPGSHVPSQSESCWVLDCGTVLSLWHALEKDMREKLSASGWCRCAA